MNIFLLSPVVLIICVLLAFWLLFRFGFLLFSILALPIKMLRSVKMPRPTKPTQKNTHAENTRTENTRRENTRTENTQHERDEFLQQERALRAALENILEAQTPPPHTILGVASGATRAELKARFRTLAMQLHPDKAASTTPEIQRLADQEFRKIKDAYETLLENAPE